MARKFNPGRTGQIERLQINDNQVNSLIPNEDIMIMPDGTGNVNLATDTVRIGDQNGNAVFTTWGTGDLTINTNNGTNSGVISIPDGTNQAIAITPNGSGDVQLNADTVRVGDQNGNATVTTWGSGDLTLNTNGGSNSGYIQILDGSGQDIRIYPNGSGNIRLGTNTNSEVNLSATTDSTGTGNGALVVPGGVGVAKQLRVGGAATFSSTVTANFNPTSDAHLTRKSYTDLVGGLDWNYVTGNTTMSNYQGYLVSTASGARTMTLPSNPAAGSRVRIIDYDRNFETNNCTVARNGQNIMGVAENLVLDVNEINLELVFVSGRGWWVTQLT